MKQCVTCKRIYRDPVDAEGLCNICAQRKRVAARLLADAAEKKAREDRFVKQALQRWTEAPAAQENP